MNYLNHTTLLRVAAIALIVTAAGCKKNDAPIVADTTSMANPAPMNPAPAALRVSSIETGKGINADKTVKDDAHDFGVRDTVYVSVKTEGSGSGTLAAKFTFQDGQTVEQSSQSITPTGDAIHEFHIQKASAWPKGDYKVEVTLDGVSAGTKDFTVK
jgi:hypothetical protein